MRQVGGSHVQPGGHDHQVGIPPPAAFHVYQAVPLETGTIVMLANKSQGCRAKKPVDKMHIIERGMVMRAAKVHKPYHVIGEEMLISGRSANVGVIALTHVLTLAIGLDSFRAVLQEFPSMQAIIRRNIVRDLLLQGVRPNHDAPYKIHGSGACSHSPSGCHSCIMTLPRSTEDVFVMFLQVLDFMKHMRSGIAALLHPDPTTTPAEFEKNYTKKQLQTLYDIKLYYRLSNKDVCKKLMTITRMLQRVAKRENVARRVIAELEKQALYHPAVLMMERELQAHGLEHHMKVR